MAPTAPSWPNPWAFEPGPIAGAAAVRVIVVAGYGVNCEAETAAGFRMLGATVTIVHARDLLEQGARRLDGCQLLVFAGGFSFGDHMASGRVLANRLRFGLGDGLGRFVDDGGLVLGICNGFQVLVKLGLLPGVGRSGGESLREQQVSLVHNDRLGYHNAWVRLRIDPSSRCAFTQRGSGELLELPSRHGEGKLIVAQAVQPTIAAEHRVAVRYADPQGQPTTRWPHNPSGSAGGAAGLCDASGRVFGLMPHPEAYLYPENHPDWIAQRDHGRLPAFGCGLGLLANGVRAVLAA